MPVLKLEHAEEVIVIVRIEGLEVHLERVGGSRDPQHASADFRARKRNAAVFVFAKVVGAVNLRGMAPSGPTVQ